MRKWASVAVVFLALACPTTALADGPPEVYSDFAEDGVLSCGHSRSALKGALNDASIHQYGDPLTFIGLKLAIRKQLAGGCRRRSGESKRSLSLFPPTGSQTSPSATKKSNPGSSKSSRGKTRNRPRTGDSITRLATAGDSADSSRDGRMVLLGVALLLLTLGSGGWAARRAFKD
jgi:hypothetical protein